MKRKTFNLSSSHKLILAFLAEKPRTAYELRELMNYNRSGCWIYTVLSQLMRNGFITKELEEHSNQKKVYSLKKTKHESK